MTPPLVRILAGIIAAGAAGVPITLGGSGYAGLIAAAVFILAAFIHEEDTRKILMTASGEILVISLVPVSLFAGCCVQCAVIGVVLLDGSVPADTRDLTIFALCCITMLMAAVLFDRLNQILLPFLLVAAACVAGTVILVGVQEMRERRMYAGGK
jgi:hypothetical protein